MNSAIDKSKWIERHKHETIVRKLQKNIRHIARNYDIKLMLQRQRIDSLMKTIQQQKDFIDSFALKGKSTIDSMENDLNVCVDSSKINNSDPEISGPVEKYSDPVIGNREIVLAINIQPNVEQLTENLPRCDLCGKVFKSRRVFLVRQFLSFPNDKLILFFNSQKHKRTVHGAVRNFICELCNKTFSFAESLKRHRRIHTGKHCK